MIAHERTNRSGRAFDMCVPCAVVSFTGLQSGVKSIWESIPTVLGPYAKGGFAYVIWAASSW